MGPKPIGTDDLEQLTPVSSKSAVTGGEPLLLDIVRELKMYSPRSAFTKRILHHNIQKGSVLPASAATLK